jgi:hypothetical protein
MPIRPWIFLTGVFIAAIVVCFVGCRLLGIVPPSTPVGAPIDRFALQLLWGLGTVIISYMITICYAGQFIPAIGNRVAADARHFRKYLFVAWIVSIIVGAIEFATRVIDWPLYILIAIYFGLLWWLTRLTKRTTPALPNPTP